MDGVENKRLNSQDVNGVEILNTKQHFLPNQHRTRTPAVTCEQIPELIRFHSLDKDVNLLHCSPSHFLGSILSSVACQNSERALPAFTNSFLRNSRAVRRSKFNSTETPLRSRYRGFPKNLRGNNGLTGCKTFHGADEYRESAVGGRGPARPSPPRQEMF